MHPHIQFGIPTSKNIGDMHRTRSGTDGQCDYYKNHVRGQGQGHIDPKIVRDTPPSKDASRLRGGSPNRGGSIDEKKRKASTHQIWKSYLKEYKRYLPDTKQDGWTVRLQYASQSSFGGIKKSKYKENTNNGSNNKE